MRAALGAHGKSSRALALIGVLLVLLQTAACAALPQGNPARPDRTSSGFFDGLIDIYGAVVSGADGNRCPMVPSCSRYSLDAFRKHGALVGWVMTCDRLARCGHDEVHLSPTLRDGNGIRTRDPLAANDFWWFGDGATR